MIYEEKQLEEEAVRYTAARMCAAARTAPKGNGVDNILTAVLTGKDKEALADKMDEIGARDFGKEKAAVWYGRDAANIRAAQAVVLIGARESYRGVPHCGLCGFGGCGACQEAGGRCAFTYIDLGIAVSSAAETAALDKADNRIMFSAGRAAEEAGYCGDNVRWLGIPVSLSGKNIFFDRKRQSEAALVPCPA